MYVSYKPRSGVAVGSLFLLLDPICCFVCAEVGRQVDAGGRVDRAQPHIGCVQCCVVGVFVYRPLRAAFRSSVRLLPARTTVALRFGLSSMHPLHCYSTHLLLFLVPGAPFLDLKAEGAQPIRFSDGGDKRTSSVSSIRPSAVSLNARALALISWHLASLPAPRPRSR